MQAEQETTLSVNDLHPGDMIRFDSEDLSDDIILVLSIYSDNVSSCIFGMDKYGGMMEYAGAENMKITLVRKEDISAAINSLTKLF